jgi:hypothetical protein
MVGKVNITPLIYRMVSFFLLLRITQLKPVTSDLGGQVEAEGPDESCPSDTSEDHKWQSHAGSRRIWITSRSKSQKARSQLTKNFPTRLAVASVLYLACGLESNERETL